MDGELSQTDNTTEAGKSQEGFAYKDAEIPNNQFSDAFSKLGIDSLFNDNDNNSSNGSALNDFTDYSKHRNGDNGNTAVLDKPSDNQNGAVDNNSVELRTKKAENYYKKAVNALRKSLSSTFNITNLKADSRVNEIIKAVTEKQVKNGRVDTKDIDALFEEMYSKGKVINDEAYKEYSDIREYLRSTRMFIAKEDANNIADYSDFIKRNMGSFFVSTTKSDGNVEVEAVYSELMDMHPELFSAEITHPADMLKRIAEVSRSIKKVETELSSYTGEEAEVYKEAAKQDFYAAVSAFSEKLNTLYRYENDTTASPIEVPDIVLKGTKQENATKQNNNRLASDDEINDFVEYSFKYAEETNVKGNKDFPKQQDHIRYAKVSEKLKNDILKHFGVKLKNKYHVLRDNDIRHLKNSHGEGTNEKYPITKDDIKQIPDIVENYDDVLWVEKDDGKKGIIYVKRHNGVTYYLEGMLNDELLINKQMIKVPTGTIPDIKGIKDAINKKWNIVASPNDKNIPRMYVQDVWSHNVPEDSITNPTEFVKENYSTANNNRIEMTEDELINLYNEKQELQKKYEKAEKDILLSDKDKYYLEGLVRGTITEAEIPFQSHKLLLTSGKKSNKFSNKTVKIT